MSLTAFTKIIVTLAVTAWVFILPMEAVATILVLQLALLLYIKHDRMTIAACCSFDWRPAHAGYDYGVFVPFGWHAYSGYCQGAGGPLPYAL